VFFEYRHSGQQRCQPCRVPHGLVNPARSADPDVTVEGNRALLREIASELLRALGPAPWTMKVAQLVAVRLRGGHDPLAEGSQTHRVSLPAAVQEPPVEVSFQPADLQHDRGRIKPFGTGEVGEVGVLDGFQEPP